MRAKSGFTIVEFIVAVTITSIVLLVFLPMITNFLSAQFAQMVHAKQVNDMYKAITIINTDLQRTIEFRRSNSIADSAFPVPNGGWNFAGTSNDLRTLILTVPATTQAYQNENRNLVMTSKTYNCSDNIKQPLSYEAIYYINDGSLYRRSLVKIPNGTHICDKHRVYQKTTTLSGSPKDMRVLTNVKSFRVNYHSDRLTTANPNAYNTSIEKTKPLEYNQATIILTSSKQINGKLSEYTATTRGSSSWNK